MLAARLSHFARAVTGSSWFANLSVRIERVLDGVRESAGVFPTASKQPRVLLAWVTSARVAQLILLAVVVCNLFIMPPLRDRFVHAVVTSESFADKVGGVFGAQSKADRRRAALSAFITSTAWVGGVAASVLLLWLHLPAAQQRRRSATTKKRSGTVAGRYQIEAEIGRGATGVVYRASDSVLERRVALKELAVAGDEDAIARFRREAKIVARLSHPNIVQVYDLAEENGTTWIAMELVDAGDLSRMLAANGPLPVESATNIALAVSRAIAHAHDAGVIHRDLKPLNLLIDTTGAVKVTDFGLAKMVESNSRTLEGTILGSPYYMSPEQADGRPADERSDVYGLGTILFHMLAGRPPFTGEIASVLMQHIRRPAPRLRDVAPGTPAELETLVQQMLEKDPTARPQTMHDVAQRLTALSSTPV